MKRVIRKAVAAVDGALMSAAFSAFGALNAFASSGGTGVDISWLNSTGNGSFDNLETTAKEAMGSFYSLTFTVSTGLCVISLIIAFVQLAIYKGQMREQAKGTIFWILVAMAGITGAISIFSLISGVSEGIFQP